MYQFKSNEQVILLESREGFSAGDVFIIGRVRGDDLYDLAYDDDGQDGEIRTLIGVSAELVYPHRSAVLGAEKYTPTYWNGIGKWQTLSTKLHKALVPQNGQAATRRGEILRCVECFYHDRHNNGDGNIYLPHFRQMAKTINEILPELEPDEDMIEIARLIGVGHTTARQLDEFFDWLLPTIEDQMFRITEGV